MPKPRRGRAHRRLPPTPVLQVGADIYCDTALICDVLEHVQPEPTLYPPHLKGVARIFAQWADTTLFWAAMALQPAAAGRGARVRQAPPKSPRPSATTARPMTRQHDARCGRPTPPAAYRSYLRRVANMADEHDFLFGAEPCVADFAAYHPLWFTRTQAPALADILQPTPSVLRLDGPHGGHRPRRASRSFSRATRSRWPSTPSRSRRAQPAGRQRLPGRPRHPAGHARDDHRRMLRPREPPKAS